jgi:hypothetical protein
MMVCPVHEIPSVPATALEPPGIEQTDDSHDTRQVDFEVRAFTGRYEEVPYHEKGKKSYDLSLKLIP